MKEGLFYEDTTDANVINFFIRHSSEMELFSNCIFLKITNFPKRNKFYFKTFPPQSACFTVRKQGYLSLLIGKFHFIYNSAGISSQYIFDENRQEFYGLRRSRRNMIKKTRHK